MGHAAPGRENPRGGGGWGWGGFHAEEDAEELSASAPLVLSSYTIRTHNNGGGSWLRLSYLADIYIESHACGVSHIFMCALQTAIFKPGKGGGEQKEK